MLTSVHPWGFVLVLATASYLAGLVLVPALLRWQIIDNPNPRSSHARPTVRGGGIGMVFVVLLATWEVSGPSPASVSWCILASTSLIAAVSFCDDIKSVGAATKFATHSVAAVAALVMLKVCGLGLIVDSGGFPWPAVALVWFLVFLWIVGYTNAFNFMDGINGLAAGQAVVTGFGMALVGGLALHGYDSTPVLCSVAVASAALGFLPHNFPQARMFMGDVGSAPLGFCLAALALWLAMDAGAWLLIPLVLLHANFVLDAGITLFRRIFRGERWYKPHREHFYQRLIRSGKSHPFVTGLEMVLQGMVLGLMVIYVYATVPVRVGLIVLVILMWLAFFAYCERLFRRTNHFCRSPRVPSHAGAQEHAWSKVI
jgi:Fuc2NAc and GlcNAc transferase